jgi:hypothetical protein
MTARPQGSASEIDARRRDEHPGNGPTVVRPEVGSITGQEMRGPGGHRRQEDHLVVWRPHQPYREEGCGRARHDLARAHERLQALTLIVPRQIAPRLVHGIRGGEQGRAGATPQDDQTGIGAIGGRGQDIGIEKDPIHRARWSSARGRSVVSDGPGIDAELPDGQDGLAVVPGIHGIRKEELGDSGRGVDLDRHCDGRANQDTVVTLLGDDQRALLDPELASHPGGNDNGATLSNPARLGSDRGRFSDCRILGHRAQSTWTAPIGRGETAALAGGR